jgi:hypothetical protein
MTRVFLQTGAKRRFDPVFIADDLAGLRDRAVLLTGIVDVTGRRPPPSPRAPGTGFHCIC